MFCGGWVQVSSNKQHGTSVNHEIKTNLTFRAFKYMRYFKLLSPNDLSTGNEKMKYTEIHDPNYATN